MALGRSEVGPFPVAAAVHRPDEGNAFPLHLAAGGGDILHQEPDDRRLEEIPLAEFLVKDLDEVAVWKCQFRAAHTALRPGKPSLATNRKAEHISVEGNGRVRVRRADTDPLDALHDHC